MKKLILVISLITAFSAPNAFSEDNPIQFSIDQPMPEGLSNGLYTISLDNVAVKISDIKTPVTNGNAGLLPQINFLNQQILTATYNGEPMYDFGVNLTISLYCQNGKWVTYQYDNTQGQIRLGGPVTLPPPDGC